MNSILPAMTANRPVGAKLQRAIDWFVENGVQSTIDSCMIGASVSRSTARDARAALKARRVIPTNFSPRDSRRSDVTAARPKPVLTVERDTRDLPALVATPPQPSPPADSPPTTDAADELAASILARVLAGGVEVLTPQQQLAFMSEEARLARPGTPHRLAALKALGAAQVALGSHNELGPGVPQTRSAMVFRASNILKACGRAMARDVWTTAFGETITAIERVERTGTT